LNITKEASAILFANFVISREKSFNQSLTYFNLEKNKKGRAVMTLPLSYLILKYT